MEFSVNSFRELKLLVECIDVNRISDMIKDADGWGTAGTMIVDAGTNRLEVLPVSGPGRSGAIISQPSGDNIIVTKNPRAFVWFAKVILASDLPEPGPVAWYESLPVYHLGYCMSHPNAEEYDIKDELLYICDQLINIEKVRKASMKSPMFFDEDEK